jgi:Ketopantoate hydroxymethyltransferase
MDGPVYLQYAQVRMSHHPSMDKPQATIPWLQQQVRDGRRLVMTTAYDVVTARIADPFVDMILVGDSVGNVCLGFENTLPVSMAMMNIISRPWPAPSLARCSWPTCPISAITSA